MRKNRFRCGWVERVEIAPIPPKITYFTLHIYNYICNMKHNKQKFVLDYLSRPDIHVDSFGNLWFHVKTQKLCRMRSMMKLPTGYSQYILINESGEKCIVYRHVLSYLAKTRRLYPEGCHIDHIDRDIDNCRWDNLRAVSPRENQMNSKKEVFTEWRTIRGKEIEDIKKLMSQGLGQAEIARKLNLNRLSVRYTMKQIEAGKKLKYEGWGVE